MCLPYLYGNTTMYHIMLDLETLGAGPSAAIIAIGAAEFNLTTGDIVSTFYQNVDLDSAVRAGGEMDPATVLWWMGQSDLARSALTKKGLRLRDVLSAFSAWVLSRESLPELTESEVREQTCVWGNGAGFDNVILREAYLRLDARPPWDWRLDRCYRTVKALAPHIPAAPPSGVRHHALDDAINQAKHLSRVLSSVAA